MKLPHLSIIGGKLYTENPVKGYNPFSEQLRKEKGIELRTWNPNRSKLGAAIVKGIKEVPINEDSKILYLGAAHAYTPSQVASIAIKGIVYAIEFSERCFKDMIPLTEKYVNIVPILADARFPDKYGIFEQVDIVYCDIADRQMTEIAIDNCKKFLKAGGILMLAIKARSIDVTESPKKIIQQEIQKLRDSGFEILDWKMLDPFEKDHGFAVARK